MSGILYGLASYLLLGQEGWPSEVSFCTHFPDPNSHGTHYTMFWGSLRNISACVAKKVGDVELHSIRRKCVLLAGLRMHASVFLF